MRKLKSRFEVDKAGDSGIGLCFEARLKMWNRTRHAHRQTNWGTATQHGAKHSNEQIAPVLLASINYVQIPIS